MPVVKTPWKRVRCARGGGTRAASLAMTNRQDCRFGRPQVARRDVRHQLHRLEVHVRRAVLHAGSKSTCVVPFFHGDLSW